jgi:hypothetical protein
MKSFLLLNHKRITIFLFIAILLSGGKIAAQKIVFGVFADPVISWFSTDISAVKNDGTRAGFNFGLTFNSYFSPNYAFSTGINIMTAGGRLVGKDTTVMKFTNYSSTVLVLPGKPVVYKIQYLDIPLGLKLKTNQIGYLTFFSDLGLDPMIVIGGKADIPSLKIEGENAISELNRFNLGYHITAGGEYSLGGTTAIVFGLGFQNNFLDVTKDINDQLKDKVSHKILRFRLGVNF